MYLFWRHFWVFLSCLFDSSDGQRMLTCVYGGRPCCKRHRSVFSANSMVHLMTRSFSIVKFYYLSELSSWDCQRSVYYCGLRIYCREQYVADGPQSMCVGHKCLAKPSTTITRCLSWPRKSALADSLWVKREGLAKFSCRWARSWFTS